MPLGLKAYHVAGSAFSPRIEYNAKAGRMHVVNRREVPDGAAFATDKIDVTMSRPEFALDIGSIEIGWIHFPPGAGPDAALVPYGQAMPTRPSSRHKAGFQVQVWNGCEPEAREFKSTAGVVVDVIEDLWTTFEAAPEARRGQVPVVRFVDVVAMTAARGTNYAPVFELVQWIERDDRVFGPRTVAPPNGNAAPQPAAPSLPAISPAPAQRQVPAAVPAPQPARAW